MNFYQKIHLWKNKILPLLLAILLLEFSFPHQMLAQNWEAEDSTNLGPVLVQIGDGIYNNENFTPALIKKPKMVRYVTVTAYSSTVDQCDDTPFITANGKTVYDGLVAANFLKFGTEVKFPDHFGDKVFTVNDRMNPKYDYRIDVWMPTREQAIQFGTRYLKVEIY